MRIISGKLGGRRIQPPAHMPYTRPTTDIAKEGLFNILQNNLDFEALKTLDLFGGTGSISYELASRGVGDLTVVEKDTQMFAFIKKTAAALQLKNFKIVKSDVFRFMATCREKFDFIFAGPPYALTAIDEIPDLIFEKGLLNEDGWFVLEHTPRNDYKAHPHFLREKNYGTTVFTFFGNAPADGEAEAPATAETPPKLEENAVDNHSGPKEEAAFRSGSRLLKKQARKIYNQKRIDLSYSNRLKGDDLILINFQSLVTPPLNTVLSFYPMEERNEVNAFLITDYLHFRNPNLQICYPRMEISAPNMEAVACQADTIFEANAINILEPLETGIVEPAYIDLVLVPMLVCDELGNRVGFGKGYYDRYLSRCRPDCVKVGLSYFDPVERILDANEFDVPLDFCITPEKVYVF